MRLLLPIFLGVCLVVVTPARAEKMYAVRQADGDIVLTNVPPVDGGGRALTGPATSSAPAAVLSRPSVRGAPAKQRPYAAMVHRISEHYGVDHNLVHAVIAVESSYNPRAVSVDGALGLMQLMPGTAAEMGIHNPLDAHDNVLGGVRYLRRLLDRYSGNVTLALAAYNAGSGAVARHRGVPPYKETREYVRKVRRIYSGQGFTARPEEGDVIHRYTDSSGALVFSQFSRGEGAGGRRR